MTVKAWKVIGRCLLVLLCVVLVIAIVGIAQFFHRSDPKNVKRYDTDNPSSPAKRQFRRTAAARAIIRRRRWPHSAAAWKIRILRWIILNSTCI